MDTKTCTKCHETKALTEFHAASSRLDGRKGACKVCVLAARKVAYLANPEKFRAASAAWAAKNPEKVRANNTKNRRTKGTTWYAENREKALARSAAWAAKNREKVRAAAAKRHAANPGKGLARAAKSVAVLSPSYVATKLHVPVAQLTPELLELKRQQLELHRLERQLHKLLKEKP